MVKRVLLTGASGFFGSHLLRHLLINTDWEFVCICSWKYKGTPERIENALAGQDRDRVAVITHDLIAPMTRTTKKRLGKIDYILNIASNSHVQRSIESPGEFIIGNTLLAYHMFELARELRPELFLQFSTDEVYGDAPVGVDYKEWSAIRPSNPYSASKANQENIAFAYWRTYNVPVIITNTMNLFGETQDPEKYIAQLVRRINDGETVTVHGREGEIGSRYYLHARNGADAVLFIIKNIKPVLHGEGADRPERFNIVGDVEVNNLELATMVAKLLEKNLDYRLEDFHSTRPGHDRRYALDGSKLREAGWKAPMDFGPSLRKSIEWTLLNKQWL
jgi:dTDP-glucose 4,6-dehydratase